MKVLIVNPILYTSETHGIKKVNSIKDTMIYDLCLAFREKGVDVTLAAAADYKPACEEDYPFKIVWLETKLKGILFPNVIPYCPGIKSLIKREDYDLIITSEVFSLNSFMLARMVPQKLIIWHELAKHNRIMHKIPSKLWYGVVVRLFFGKVLVVPRSNEARDFISHYCKRVSDKTVDHGVNLEKFTAKTDKENYFAVSSQLIERKQIDRIITAFAGYLNKYDSAAALYIMGSGDEERNLKAQTRDLGIENNVIFTGKLPHDALIEKLHSAKAMLVYTRKDNNMVSIVESIAVGTPVITTSVPYNAGYIKANSLGIVNDCWDEDDIKKINDSNGEYVKACLDYRQELSTLSRVDTFLEIARENGLI